MKTITILFFSLIMLNNISAISTNLNINVGSCFDYPPLTYIDNNNYLGSEVQIIKNFAQDNNFSITFIHTSWSQLHTDLNNNKFTIAVGGINDTKTRRRLFLISDPINNSQKVALIRCQDNKRFTTLSAIDQPSVKIIENRGGTNEDFAIKHIKNATIIIAENNQLPFTYLLTKQSDAMFTDDIEAIYKHSVQPKLCMAKLKEKFPSTPKVFLFTNTPSGHKLHLQFNRWWKQQNKI